MCLERIVRTMTPARWVFLCVGFVFLCIGTLGHEPWWKHGETYTFGMVYTFYQTHTWLIPMNAGDPFMEKPPLFYWLAVILGRMFSGVMPLYDAVSIASVLCTMVTIYFSYLSGYTLFANHPQQERMARINTALMMGTYVVLHTTHAFVTDVGLLTGVSIAVYGFVLWATTEQRWKAAGFWAGIGFGIAFMTKGILMPGILAVALVVLLFFAEFRTAQRMKALGVALLAASPFLVIWPGLLYMESPGLFHEWFWNNNIGRFLGFSVKRLGAENDRFHLIELMLTFAQPVLTLALYTLWRQRKEWKQAQVSVPLVLTCVSLAALFTSASCRVSYIMPLAPVLALLATQAYIHLEPKLSRVVQSVLYALFSIAVLGVWAVWWSINHPAKPFRWLAEHFDKWIPLDFVPASQSSFVMLLAVLVSALLFWRTWRSFAGKIRDEIVMVYLLGAMVMWIVSYGIMMPWVDEKHTMKSIITRFTDYYASSPYGKSKCLGLLNLGEDMSPMLLYYTQGNLPTSNILLDHVTCPVMLTMVPKTDAEDIGSGWQLEWADGGFGDIKGMELRFYARKN